LGTRVLPQPKEDEMSKPATMRDYAKVDFKAWKNPEGKLIPSDKTLARFGIPARLAYATMLRTKDELIDGMGRLPIVALDELLTHLSTAERDLKEIAGMIESAQLRILSALSAAEIAKGSGWA
jgi:hypothetical protein